jgi:hypothetical protein
MVRAGSQFQNCHGKGLYGRVDQVKGRFHVATEFYHLYGFPFVPVKSFIVITETEKNYFSYIEFQGIKIPLSRKSIFAAYFRNILIICTIFTLIAGINLSFGKSINTDVTITFESRKILVSVLGFLAYWASYRFLSANEKTAQVLEQYLSSRGL